jgi:hypothetical protein
MSPPPLLIYTFCVLAMFREGNAAELFGFEILIRKEMCSLSIGFQCCGKKCSQKSVMASLFHCGNYSYRTGTRLKPQRQLPWVQREQLPLGFSQSEDENIKLRGLSPQANYTDRATAAVGEVSANFCG